MGSIVSDALDFFTATARGGGGFAATAGWSPDPRTTAWVLLAGGLVRRTGLEGAFHAEPHVDYLRAQLSSMTADGRLADSVADNLSLARAALQVWGKPAAGIAFIDGATGNATTLAAAWESRYDADRGSYGSRVDEHLFGGFASWIFEPAGPRRAAMADHVVVLAGNGADTGAGPQFSHDMWLAAYGRVALGSPPRDAALAQRFEASLDARQTRDGGSLSSIDATQPDASSTAAALLAWAMDGRKGSDENVEQAVSYLCAIQGKDGAIPLSATQNVARTKTTAEVAIAIALVLEPIPWQDPQAG